MSDVAIRPKLDGEGAFRPLTMLFIAALGLLAFVGMLVLGAYAPDLRSGRNGGSHALSNAATGFSGIVQLARATGRDPQIMRNEALLSGEDLVVLTPENGSIDLGETLGRRTGKTTLIVLPKWDVEKDRGRAGWVRSRGLTPIWNPEAVLAPAYKLKVERHRTAGAPLRTVPDYAPPEMRFTAPRLLQTFSAGGFRPIVEDGRGRAVVAQFGDQPVYVLADPDLLSNQGMADLHQAAAALALLDFLNATDSKSIVFDVTLNGLGRSQSPLKLIFDPPFLATTLALAAAALLAALHALVRFGPARRPERALAFGKAALIDNTAALVRKAGRESALGGRYADMVRERAMVVFGVPARLRDGVDAYLDNLGGSRRFSALARTAGEAQRREDVLAAAQALHQWQKENEW